jgi:hypothetical protein
VPELYGKPFKYELRKEIRALSTMLDGSARRARNFKHEARMYRELFEETASELRELRKKLRELGADPPTNLTS